MGERALDAFPERELTVRILLGDLGSQTPPRASSFEVRLESKPQTLNSKPWKGLARLQDHRSGG